MLFALFANEVNDGHRISWHEHWKALQLPFDNAARSFSLIYLRLNSDEKDERAKALSEKLLAKLKEVRTLVRENKYDEAATAADELNDLTRPVLKAEWERVKAGERLYRWSRNFAGIILLIGLILVLVVAMKANVFWTVGA
jgi:hypothetical protein